MDRKQIEQSVIAALAAVLKCEVGADTSRQNTPQWDSLKHIEIIFSVEDELGIEFSEKEMAGLDSVAEIVSRAMTLHAA
jgi:acyl carrier protein